MSSRPIVPILAVAVILFGVGVAFADAPVAQDDAATVDGGGTVTMLDSGETSLLANDSDAEGLTLTTTPTNSSDGTKPADGTLFPNRWSCLLPCPEAASEGAGAGMLAAPTQALDSIQGLLHHPGRA